MALTKRWTSRVLLMDGDDRLLLLCGCDPRRPGARWWFTVGGAVEKDEDYLQAAVREMWEEAALCLPVGRLSPVVWTRQAIFSVDGRTFDQYEEYRLARGTADEVREMNVSTEEARYGHHWWSTAELATTAEIVRPKKMASLLPDVPATVGLGRAPVYRGNVNEDTDPE
ncbi:DNA mismatch repair protein MutT [Streptomyces sp. CB02959]|uniref:NUDIX hydrolase n=1 Tax=Streptomyces sp. CB02959 TaxID=2020330 RepID=UPI000C27EDA5|nr:NUDIX domain-containing protein [Streptomyces sp. CB02959]PJN31620.1 DNA mismatch repair protein MutT [Streptomyces sp. CB02959]